MAGYRKLSRPTDQRLAILRGLVTSLLNNGKITTTVQRAKEVRDIANSLIADAIKETDNVTSKQIKISVAKLDSKGNKILKAVTSKNGRKYSVVEREEKTEMVTVDKPSRLQARRKAINWVNRLKSDKGENVNVVNKLFDEIAPKFKSATETSGTNGGYTRMYKIGPRRGDAAEMAILELCHF